MTAGGITRKRLLYKSKVEYMSGEGVYTANIAQGCAHGCKYPCYAFAQAMRYGTASGYADWCDAKAVDNATELLRSELERRRKEPVRRIHFCFTTDPFMRGRPDIAEKALECIAVANGHGVPVTVLTKGDIPVGESAIETMAGHPENEIGVTVASTNVGFQRKWEPNAATVGKRVGRLHLLNAHGIRTWASLEPFPALTAQGTEKRYGTEYRNPPMHEMRLPEYPDDEYNALRNALHAVEFVNRLVFGRWNYNAEMPSDVADIRGWYIGAASIVRDFCREHGIECHIKEGTE